VSSHIVLKDAFRQLLGRLLSAAAGFLVITLMTPYLEPARYGDYSTILKYFAIWSALADFGLYVIALKKLGEIKNQS
jgi:O-antigen/teichoic acid export membrane protein